MVMGGRGVDITRDVGCSFNQKNYSSISDKSGVNFKWRIFIYF